MTTVEKLTIEEGKKLFDKFRDTNIKIPKVFEGSKEKKDLERAYILYESTIYNDNLCKILNFSPTEMTQLECHALIKLYYNHPDFYDTLLENCKGI